jgi:fatty-acyl-CoA synthase
MVLSIMACVTHGSAMYPLLWYTPMKVMHVVDYEKCTAVHGVPSMFISILDHRDFNDYKYDSLRTGIMAGASCPVEIMERVLKDMNMREVVITYGQTEASPAITMSSTTDSVETRVSTVGRPIPGVQVKIVDPETGKDLPDNTPGELCARGYNIMKDYYNMKEATEAVLKTTIDGKPDEKWLHTGDLAIRLPDGNYKITGRIKDIIIRGGENISPKEIEDLIYTHPAVKDVSVVAIPSERYGEEIGAFVIHKDGEDIDADKIKTFVGNKLARHKVPKEVLFVESFPQTASGKVQKYKLREMAVDKLGLERKSKIETV